MPSKDRLDFCRKRIAETIADVIIEKFRFGLIKKIIEENYQYFDESIRKKLYKNMREALKIKHKDEYKNKIINNQKEAVFKEILAHIETNNRLIIEGFIKFRMGDFIRDLKEKVADVVDEYLLEKEYDDFIDLLRYFVEIQEPRVDKVHVIIRRSGVFELFDDKYDVIDNEYLESFILEMVDSELSYEDLLISALITIAPLEVVVHLPDYNGFCDSLMTIQKVFEKRVSLCGGCPKCKQLKHKKF